MVFETLAADIAVRTNGLGAWVTAVRRFGRGLVPWFAEGPIRWFGLGVISSFRSGRVLGFASGPIGWAASSPIRWFGSKLVEQIGRELLARSFRREQLLRAYGSPSETAAGPLSLPGLSVPPSFRLWMGRDLTLMAVGPCRIIDRGALGAA
jgi:hypothetical protein